MMKAAIALCVGGAFAKGEVKGGPLVNGALRPDATAMPVYDALEGGQPDACPLKLGRAMEALKGCEELVGIGHLKARPIVAHEKSQGSIRLPEATDLNARLWTLGSELPSIAQ